MHFEISGIQQRVCATKLAETEVMFQSSNPCDLFDNTCNYYMPFHVDLGSINVESVKLGAELRAMIPCCQHASKLRLT